MYREYAHRVRQFPNARIAHVRIQFGNKKKTQSCNYLDQVIECVGHVTFFVFVVRGGGTREDEKYFERPRHQS